MRMSFAFLLLLTTTCVSAQKVSTRTTIDHAFSLRLSTSIRRSEDLLGAMRPLNDKLIYVAVLILDTVRVPFAISRYPNSEKESRQIAFAKTLQATATGAVPAQHTVLQAGLYETQGKELCCKVSRIVFKGGKTVESIMYYFM